MLYGITIDIDIDIDIDTIDTCIDNHDCLPRTIPSFRFQHDDR